jgi:ATP-dependent DNA ligase
MRRQPESPSRMTLEVPLTLVPIEALPVNDLPTGAGWLFEPKYDGFRCLLFRDGDTIQLQSRRQRPLGRYFPEVIEATRNLPIERLVFDGELIIPDQPFDALQLRLHPAASRVQMLSREHPAQVVVFDLLANGQGQSLLDRSFTERRAALEAALKRLGKASSFVLSKATTSADTARKWLRDVGHGLDGIMAKRLDLPYRPGERMMQKFKLWKTVDCVVGGIYYRPNTNSVEYLLMGLYDDVGRLNYVGRCGVGDNGHEIGKLLKPLIGGSGFTGNAPGGKSRWSSGRERKPVPLKPQLVAEVSADHIENGRFRHGSRLVRWRDDKEPTACTMDQII